MSPDLEVGILTERLYNAVLNCPHRRLQSFLVLRRDIFQDNPEDTKKQLKNRLRREVRAILREVYGRKIEVD
jgi:hypothetical protein